MLAAHDVDDDQSPDTRVVLPPTPQAGDTVQVLVRRLGRLGEAEQAGEKKITSIAGSIAASVFHESFPLGRWKAVCSEKTVMEQA